jgi:muramoyltetrapeptide carboxypeptidase
MTHIAVCAPSTPFTRDDAARVEALVAQVPGLSIAFHDQCFASEGHFAGNDALRLAAFVECANDPAVDAVWFARGGYGAGRIAQDAMGRLGAAARGKTYLGYSDGGVLLAALYRAGIGRPVHAPMPVDLRRAGGEAAVRRVLDWLAGDPQGLEPSLVSEARPVVAFNLMTLAMIMGTPVMPDLAGHVVMVEEVSEHDYAVDRLLFHVTAGLQQAGLPDCGSAGSVRCLKTIGLLAFLSIRWYATGATGPGWPFWAGPTSGTMPITGLSPSGLQDGRGVNRAARVF